MFNVSKFLTIIAFGALLGAAHVQAEPPSCPICLDDYTRDSLVIQFDCPGNRTPVNHHVCLGCANSLIGNNQRCPICRAGLSIHTPYINENTVHHLYRNVTAAEQGQINQLFRAPISRKPAPDSVFNYCAGCKSEHEEGLLVRFTCTHDLCVPTALNLAQSGSATCPTCNTQLHLVDPLKKENGQVEVMYHNRIATSDERAQLEKLRSAFSLYQLHIPAQKRVPVQPRQQAPQIPPVPGQPAGQAPSIRPTVNQNQRPDELPEVAGLFPDRPLTHEEIRLTNTYLPAHLSKTVWQVVVQPDGTYAQARRARELSHWPSASKQNVLPNFINRDFAFGALCGLLVSPELKQKNTTLRRLGAIPAFLISGKELYDTYQKDPQKGFDNFIKWGTGFVGALLTYAWKSSQRVEDAR